jgi:hypothetical protein
MTLAATQISRLSTPWSGVTLVSPESPRSASRFSPLTSQIPQAPLPTDDEKLDQLRIDAMGTLVSILKRNTRVRYEIDVVEVIKASVAISTQP